MTIFSPVLTIFILLLIATLINAKNNKHNKKETEDDDDSITCVIQDYVLAIQYDCGFESIHGLWPDPVSLCNTCADEVFSTSKLSTKTLSDMNKYWPTCYYKTNDAFWSHEWSKHGTCTGMTQEAYFSKGLALFKSYKSKCSDNCNLCFSTTFKYQGIC